MFKIVIFLIGLLSFVSADSLLLKTGQTIEYAPDDDGAYQKGIAHIYTRNNTTGIVSDSATGLQWQDNIASEKRAWITQENYNDGNYSDTSGDTAITYCAELNLDGANWRLPTIEELIGITDKGSSNPSLDSIFQNIFSDDYWSTTVNISDSSSAWAISFYSGADYWFTKNTSLNIRCVRGEQIAISTTSIRDDETQTIYDHMTNLTWQDEPYTVDEIDAYNNFNGSEHGKVLRWINAINYCENLSFAGVQDWRLPNINELYMIADRSKYNSAIDSSFQNTISSTYWSSTTDISDISHAWSVYFYNGNDLWRDKNSSMYTRCVRSGQIVFSQTFFIPTIMYLLH